MATNSSYTIKRSLLSGGFVINYKVKGELLSGAISNVIFHLINSIISNNNLKNLLDIAGVNNELIKIEGKTGVTGDRKETFKITLQSRFIETTKDHHLVSSLNEERSGDIPDWLSIREIGVALPLSPTLVELRLKIYKPKRFIGILGFMPTEIGEVTFISKTDTFNLNIRYISSSREKKVPLKDVFIDKSAYSVFDSLRKAIEESSGFDIEGDILNK